MNNKEMVRNAIPIRRRQSSLEDDDLDIYGDMLRLMHQPEREMFERLPSERQQRIYSDFRMTEYGPEVLLFKDMLLNLESTISPTRYKRFVDGMNRAMTFMLNGNKRLADREFARMRAQILYE